VPALVFPAVDLARAVALVFRAAGFQAVNHFSFGQVLGHLLGHAPAPLLMVTRGMHMVALEVSGTKCPSSSAMFRLLATSSLDKLPIGRESWMSSPRCSTHGKVTKHDPQDLEVTSLRQWLSRAPASVIDAGLAAAVAVAVGASRRPGARLIDVFAYALGSMLAALVLVRRRWPVAVLVASAAILHVYYLVDYPGILPAVPLAVALAGAWAAGHVRWSLLVAAWFVGGPFLFRTLAEPEPLARVLNDSVADAALFGAVLLLGEAVRTRRALRREHHLLLAEQEKSERLLLNVLPASIAARLKDTESRHRPPAAVLRTLESHRPTPRSRRHSPPCLYRPYGIAITDEASPFALRSTRNRLRRAMRQGAAWPAERPGSWLLVRSRNRLGSQRASLGVVTKGQAAARLGWPGWRGRPPCPRRRVVCSRLEPGAPSWRRPCWAGLE
jgi:hypothetical protein